MPAGELPVGADGKPLNLDFESGSLKDWTAEGDAFRDQPIAGDTVNKRRKDMHSKHQGQYWIGGYERFGDKPQGTLTSVAFRVTHPWASFLVGGGPWVETCVEIVRKDSGKLIVRHSGLEEEDLRPVAVDLREHLGQEIFVRVVDRHSGHWGHVNFDNVRFHKEQPKIPARPTASIPPAPDTYRYAGLTPQKAAEAMTVPEDFQVTLFAGEPDIRQPIAFCIDDRGRLWVAEAHCYPRRQPEGQGKDRILIFEDTNGDGKFDKRIVFMEGLNLVSGLEVGFGGVWIGAAPYLMFVPIDASGDKPAGAPKILLDGWHYEDTHETLNAFIWGPDGWLYGCHGVFTHSRIGKPGTPDEKRIPINAGVWRYHPIRHEFEVFAHGTSNPWGLDFDDFGEAFVEACVIPHCFHLIDGGRYNRQAGLHFNPHTYIDIQTIADHRHYLGPSPHGGNNRSDSAGGGHAHCGLMCYLGGTWGEQYRNQLFMGNIHGRRINVDVLKSNGSGYSASHGKDFLLANDAWARFINFRYGPDGNVFVIDWYDQQACHRNEPEIWDRSNGRIYKVSRRGVGSVQVNLQKDNDSMLVLHQLHGNDWYSRHGRRLLAERFGTPEQRQEKPATLATITKNLHNLFINHPLEIRRLRALWCLNVIGALNEDRIRIGLEDKHPQVRGWTIRLAVENKMADGALLEKLQSLSMSDPSPIVRRYLASAALRLPPASRWQILEGLASHVGDANDPNLPCMVWYTAESLVEHDAARVLGITQNAKLPRLLPLTVKRIAGSGKPESLDTLVNGLGRSSDVVVRRAYLSGILDALKGRRQVDAPNGWAKAASALLKDPNEDVRQQTLRLSVLFGDPTAFAQLRLVLQDPKAPIDLRREALDALVSAKDEKFVDSAKAMIETPQLRASVIRGLAAFDDPRIPDIILQSYATFDGAERRDAVGTLAARVPSGLRLLQAIGEKRIPAVDVPADIIRQLRNLRHDGIDKQIEAVWGVVRNTPADRAKLMKQYRQMVMKASKAPDLHLGRALFAKTCQQCHTLFGIGGNIGPDITGANRSDLNYLLENVLDPSALIQKEYLASRIELKNGRVITGIVKAQNAATDTVATATETIVIPRADIDEILATNVSMMPDDQLKPFTDHEVRSLFAYLQSPAQTPMLATTDNAKDFFNGKDLTGWTGDLKLWSVENGEIIGKSPGIKRNEFLKSHMLVEDFRLKLKVKLTPNKENSGIQFRSEPLQNGEMKGPQADIGAGWWGKLYEESGRGLLWDKSGEQHVNRDGWNDYEIVAIGNHVRTYINGQLCVDLKDDKLSRKGLIALQIHSGGPMEVRFKDLKLDVNPK
jgi:putative membrane-bound dehydrogenase-like protein